RVDHSLVPVARPTKFSTVFGAVSSSSFALMSPMLVTSVAYLAMPISSLFGLLPGGGECLPDRVIADLPEILVPLSDCQKRLRRREAHYLIDLGGELPHRLARSNGHRDDQAGLVQCALRPRDGRASRPRRDANVHADHQAYRDRWRRAVPPATGRPTKDVQAAAA